MSTAFVTYPVMSIVLTQIFSPPCISRNSALNEGRGQQIRMLENLAIGISYYSSNQHLYHNTFLKPIITSKDLVVNKMTLCPSLHAFEYDNM